ncbi:hypothetical protein JCM18899A_24130 [Nocardioides sp. AN3]
MRDLPTPASRRKRRKTTVQAPSARPTYLVTAPHIAASRKGDLQVRMPEGEWHARQEGSLQTVCGRSAVTWRLFWTLRFDRAGPRACRDCAQALVNRADYPSVLPAWDHIHCST